MAEHEITPTEERERLLPVYTAQRKWILDYIDTYIKNYGITNRDNVDLSGISRNDYEAERLRICRITDEKTRQKETGLLQIKQLGGYLESLELVLKELNGASRKELDKLRREPPRVHSDEVKIRYD